MPMADGGRTKPSSRRWAGGFALAAAIAVWTISPGLAVEEDSNPQAAARNPDYAAGKQAFDRKDWARP